MAAKMKQDLWFGGGGRFGGRGLHAALLPLLEPHADARQDFCGPLLKKMAIKFLNMSKHLHNDTKMICFNVVNKIG